MKILMVLLWGAAAAGNAGLAVYQGRRTDLTERRRRSAVALALVPALLFAGLCVTWLVLL